MFAMILRHIGFKQLVDAATVTIVFSSELFSSSGNCQFKNCPKLSFNSDVSCFLALFSLFTVSSVR